MIDSEGRIFACYAGMPFDDGRQEGYQAACRSLCERIQAERGVNSFDPQEESHTRGRFPAVNFGISQGNGKSKASRLREGRRAGLIQRLREDPGLQRIASFQDSEWFLTSGITY